MIIEAIMDIACGPEHTKMKTLKARKMYNILTKKYAKYIKRKNWHTGRIVFNIGNNCSAEAFWMAGDMEVKTLVMTNVVQIIG